MARWASSRPTRALSAATACTPRSCSSPHADLADRQRYLNARSTLRTLLDLGVVPVINENDTVVTDEIKFGDNDTLAALVTNLIEADALVILTDQPGLYESDPRRNAGAVLVAQADADDPKLEAMAGGSASALAKGGMITKVHAARRAAWTLVIMPPLASALAEPPAIASSFGSDRKSVV